MRGEATARLQMTNPRICPAADSLRRRQRSMALGTIVGIPTILLLVLVVCVTTTALQSSNCHNSYHHHHHHRTTTLPCRKSTSQSTSFSLRLSDNNSNNNGNSNSNTIESTTNDDSNNDWSMVEDWALVDIVPKYTVGSTNQPYTFWTQLLHSTPELSQRTEREALVRYQELCNDPTRYSSTKERGVEQLPLAGSSPQLLRDWSLFEKGGGGGGERGVVRDGTTFLGGSLLDTGSRIWFPLHCIGRLGSDPTDMDSLIGGSGGMGDAYDVSPMLNPATLSGGFAEAAGGKIYELGDAAITPYTTPLSSSSPSQQITAGAQVTSNNDGIAGITTPIINTLNSILNRPPQTTTTTIGDESTTTSLPTFKNIGAMATISALLASSILSACIGFGAGTGAAISSGTSTPPPSLTTSRTAPSALNTATIVVRTPSSALISNGGSRTMVLTEPSVSELRARKESQVLRERRAIENVSKRLELDEGKLAELMRQEAELQGGGVVGGSQVQSSSSSVP